MAVIHGSHVSGSFHGSGSTEGAEKPAFKAESRATTKRAGTRKRAGAAMLEMLGIFARQALTGVPDQTLPRAAAETRTPNYRQRQYSSLFDQLLEGNDRNLPLPLPALHSFCAAFAVISYGGTLERNALAYSDVYILNRSREQVLVIARRLGELLRAHELLATIQEPNRHNVHGVMGALRRNAMQELAKGGIGVPLGMLAGRLCEPTPDARDIAKAWFALDQGVHAAYKEGLEPGEYLQAGLARLSPVAVHVLASVLASRPPVHVRGARDLLEAAIGETPSDISDYDGWEGLSTCLVRDAVRSHVLSRLEAQVAETARKLENAQRPDVRTAEVANLLWRDIRHTLDTSGWFYVDDAAGQAGDEKAAIEAEAEHQFAHAIARMPAVTAAACLARLDTSRLISMHAHQGMWSSEVHDQLAGMLEHACNVRFHALLADVRAARSHLETVLDQDRRIATANALLVLSDALGNCERFARVAAPQHDWREDPLVDTAILKAAASLRMPGEPAAGLGQPSLRPLADAAILDLVRCDDLNVVQGLALAPGAVTEEAGRRSAHLDAAADARMAQLSDLLRSPALAPRPFTGLITAVALTETARREMMAAFEGGSGPAVQAAAATFSGELAMLLYRGDGVLPVQWTESRRHIGGLLDALRQIRAATGNAGVGADARYPGSRAALDTAISLLASLGGHFGLHDLASHAATASSRGIDPYWNDAGLVDTAPFFGLHYEPVMRRAVPLCGARHRARLLAALGMRMAQPDQSDPYPVVVSVRGEPRAVRADRRFHDAAYRLGDVSLSVDGPWAPAAIAAHSAHAGSELTRQSRSSLDAAFGGLAAYGNDMDVALTRLMMAMADGVADFVQGVREIPNAWRWSHMPEPEAVRHIHFDISELARGGYRLDVAACLETRRPDTEAHLALALQVNETGGRVIRLIVPPEVRLMPAMAVEPRDTLQRPVTTATVQHQAPAAVSGGALLAAEGG